MTHLKTRDGLNACDGQVWAKRDVTLTDEDFVDIEGVIHGSVCAACMEHRRPCDECGYPVPPLELWQQVVERGSGLVLGHRTCIQDEWGVA